MKKQKKRNKKKTLRNKADRLFQTLGMMKHKRCDICGKPADCMHHFITKGASAALRYDEDNGIPICTPCHCKLHLSQDPLMIARIISKRDEEWLDSLEKKRQAQIKTTIGYYESIIEHLKGEILNQENQ